MVCYQTWWREVEGLTTTMEVCCHLPVVVISFLMVLVNETPEKHVSPVGGTSRPASLTVSCVWYWITLGCLCTFYILQDWLWMKFVLKSFCQEDYINPNHDVHLNHTKQGQKTESRTVINPSIFNIYKNQRRLTRFPTLILSESPLCDSFSCQGRSTASDLSCCL